MDDGISVCRSMRIYQNHYRDPMHESHGYSYHTSKADAQRAARKNVREDPGSEVQTEVMEFPISKAGLLRALNRCGTHPDNG